jgi:guanosine-3',5'-bis(diphosphate) 3'-pyrophosphohydrolase
MQTPSLQDKFAELLSQVSKYASGPEVEKLKEAFERSRRLYEGYKWVSEEPYLFHNVDMALMLAGMQQDIPSLIAALAHDCLDHAPQGQAGSEEGEEVAGLLRGLGRLRGIEARSQSLEQADNLRRMIINEARDLRTLILHLADHGQAMQSLDHFPEKERRRILDLSTKVYAPLAGRLGIHRLGNQLEDLGLMHTNPAEYEGIIQALSKTQIEREKYIDQVAGSISAMLAERGIRAEVHGRVKHIASIHKKMKRQGVTLSGIYDIIAFRILVDSEQKCWEVLGIIHGRWTPIPGRFRDYLSQPKKNGYRSLHLTVVGPRKERMEIQIRTHEMHRVAEEGIAAHWRYKESGRKVSTMEEKQLRWITTSLEDEDEAKREDVFASEIYVFTPAGAVIALPRGATPLDFAYTIHTTVGNRTAAALVNGAMVPLSHPLKSGDLVKIVTKPGQHPSKDWLEIATTTRARTKIRSYLNAILRQEQIERGRQLLERYLRDRSLSLAKMEKKGRLKKVIEDLKSASMEEIYLRLASGKLDAAEVHGILQPHAEKPQEGEGQMRIFEGITRDSGDIRLGDIRGLMVRFAGCCKPLPGDEIKGFVTRGRGVTIHRAGCPLLLAGDKERRVDITWDIGEGMKTRAGLKILAEETPGILAKLTQFISAKGFNVTAARSERTKDGDALNLFTFEISSASELVDLIRSLEKLAVVKSIERV